MGLKKIIQALTPPKQWKVPVIIILGTFMGTASYSFYVSRAWSYLSKDPATCVNCHVMTTHYELWVQ